MIKIVNSLFIWAVEHLFFIKIAAITWTAFILIMCLIPTSDIPKGITIPHFDKVVHFFLYFILCILIFLIFRVPKWTIKALLIVVNLLFFSLFVEIMQYMMPYGRSFSILDLIANTCGILTALIIFPKNIYSETYKSSQK